MKPHKKIYLTRRYSEDGSYTWANRRGLDEDLEYISKKHLIQWLKKRRKTASITSPVQEDAYKRVIDRINYM